ncbi:MAG TPA: amino acid ABC transporter permease [Frankiaceae bacterium]|jgi:glutamate transport system permease protein|nr:amino acid ABC transporter permease [Frankiaceae bacterium]
MDVVLDNLDTYVTGFRMTLWLSVLSFALAMVLGTVVATMRVSPVAPLRAAGLAYVETFRNIPLTVFFALAVFGLPKVGFGLSFFQYAVMVLSLYTGAFVTEALRSGINTVAAGQAEAARSLGLTFGQTLRHVVVPQAARTVVQPVGSLFIALAKNSAIASAFAVAELTQAFDQLTERTTATVPLLVGTAIAYLAITIPAGVLTGFVERKVAFKR